MRCVRIWSLHGKAMSVNFLINRSPDDAKARACPLLSVLNDDGTLKEVRCLVERCQLWESLVDNHLGRCTLPARFVAADPVVVVEAVTVCVT